MGKKSSNPQTGGSASGKKPSDAAYKAEMRWLANARKRAKRHAKRLEKKKEHMESRAFRACLSPSAPDFCNRGPRERRRWGDKALIAA